MGATLSESGSLVMSDEARGYVNDSSDLPAQHGEGGGFALQGLGNRPGKRAAVKLAPC